MEKLQEAGAIVDVAPSYKTSDPEDKEAVADTLAKLVSDGSVDIITLLSAHTCSNFAELLSLGLSRAKNAPQADAAGLSDILHKVVIASIGPETSRAALELLGKVDVEASQFTRQGLVQAILDYAKNAPKVVKNH